MIEDFAKLVCGKNEKRDSFAGIIFHLENSLKPLVDEILNLPKQSPSRIALYGPFLGRSVLELTYTALIGRLDPFRLLILREMQMRLSATEGNFLGDRCKTAIQWSGDIKTSETEAVWHANNSMEKIPRSLFGKYYEEIFWIPAFTNILDEITEQKGDWFDELRSIEPKNFISRYKGECDRTYSSLSKGIHHEFVIPLEKFYSPETVFDLLKDVFRITAHTALVCHMVPTCQCGLSKGEAIGFYTKLQEIEDILCLPKS